MNTKKLILLSCLILILQSNVVYCGQGWGEWFRAKLYGPSSTKTKVETKSVDRATSPYATGMIGGLGVAAGGTLIGQGISTLSWNNEAWREISVGVAIFTVYSAISHIMQSNVNREDKIDYIKSWIRVILNNSLLYPTRASKLHVLLKKDDFLQYARLYDYATTNILDEVCMSVSEEISKAPYSEEEKVQDRQIDEYMNILKKELAQTQDLSLQKKALEGMQGKQNSIIEMRGYLSIYYRLNNQLKYEERLTPEQKQQLYGWRMSTQEAMSKLTPEELKTREEAWKKEAEKRKEIQERYKNIPKEQLIKQAREKQLEYEAQQLKQ